MQRRRQGRAPELRPPAGGVDERHAQLGLQAHARLGADAAEEPERLVIAAEEDVLAVVHQLARGRIDERGGAAAKPRAGVEDEHARAGLGETAGGGEAREASADHDRVVGGRPRAHRHPAMVFAQVDAAIHARAGRGTRTTAEKTS